MTKRLFTGLVAGLVLALFAGIGPGQQAPPKYPRGRVAPKNGPQLRVMKALAAPQLPPRCDLPEYDARADGLVPPVKNQANCGSCWDFSGTGVVEIAYRKAKMGEPDLSEQYTLSCCKNGGCNGDDNTTVLEWAEKHGLPLTKDYGPYGANESRCKFDPAMKVFKITDWGFADGGTQPGYDRVTDTQLIKNAIYAFGSVGCAVAANSSWDGYRGGVHRGNSRQIDHDVILVGWKDDQSLREGGYWIMRNSWSEQWGERGYMKIAYGADSIGTEAVYAFVTNPTPPVPPVPPAPPVPPPGPPPCHGGTGEVVAGGVLFVLMLAVIVALLVLLRNKVK